MLKGKRTNKGFTLIELLVSMTVFLIIIGISSGIFIQTIKTQRIVTSLSESMNNITLALEQIAREARTGYYFTPEYGSSNELSFINAMGETVLYKLNDVDNTIQRTIIGGQLLSITSDKVNIDNLEFRISQLFPKLITIRASVLTKEGIRVPLQTSVSSRMLD